jgi:ribosomal protein S18 acetylase RimI-like enzyme
VNTNPNINVRPATVGDKEFILSLVPRLIEFGPPSWRDPVHLTEVDTQILRDKLHQQPPGTAIFIAEDERGIALGFIHLQAGADYYHREKHGHITDLIVAPEGEGRGVGRALMEWGEEWARAQGYDWLTLSVFAENRRARALYERSGYGEDMVKYVKELS